MRVSDYIFKRLEQETNAVYYVPGGGAMFLVDALGRSSLRPVSMIHEQGAGVAAIGHAMMTGFSVCLVTSGPGVTNAMTACLSAWTDSIPVLFISGQARTEQINASMARARGLQYAPTVELVRAITKFSVELLRPDMQPIDAAIYLCKYGRRGSCWLSVPQDVQGAEL